jgi:nicotinamide-nucleotide amidase
MLAEIITIGDEILIGQVVDTNSAFLARELNKIGIRVGQITSTGDSRKQIIEALDDASRRANIVLITGGLGPTSDDITRQTLAEYFDTVLEMHHDVLDHIKTLLSSRGIEVNDRNVRQAELPRNCRLLHNTLGTAQGMWFEKNKVVFIFMPGVPFEMEAIMRDHGIPMLRDAFSLSPVQHLTILTHGLPESTMAARIESWEKALPTYIKLAYLPSPGILRLRMSYYEQDLKGGREILSRELSGLKNFISDYIFGYDDDTLEVLVGNLLRKKKLTLTIAESCTGGKIASMITSVAGCSEYFSGSVISYSNDSKCNLLGVKTASIKDHGAVSKAVVEEMAVGVRERFGADMSVATSGIAGPSGGTQEKPVGTTWIAVSSKASTISEKFTFGNQRDINIQRAAIEALFMLRKELLLLI